MTPPMSTTTTASAEPEHPLAEDLNNILARTRPLWEELRNQHIFITGGTGFFGCWLLETFLWANDQLQLNARAHVLTRNPQAFTAKAPRLANHPAITLHMGDIRDFISPAENFSHIIHAATEVTGTQAQQDPLGLFEAIVAGTRRTLQLAHAQKNAKFLLTSSGAIYGRQPPDLFGLPEDYSGSPELTLARSAYGEGKRAAEHLCALYHHQHKLDAKIARCFAFVGPYLPLDGTLAIGNFIRDALSGNPINIGGDGTPFRSYMYASDLMVWLWTLLFKGPAARPYNVGSPEALSITELAHTVAATLEPLTGTKVPVKIAQAPTPGKPAERYIPAVTRAQTELQLEITIPLGDAISKTARWAKAQDAGLKPSEPRP